YNIGTYNRDTRFKTGYLNELERMLEKVLPHATIIYDMLNRKDNSGFG
ncbi:hypothetical protein Godav_023293, partial [Gossypium davidsonii]|nr:hypothetical protein [Gossypium davidsonii]